MKPGPRLGPAVRARGAAGGVSDLGVDLGDERLVGGRERGIHADHQAVGREAGGDRVHHDRAGVGVRELRLRLAVRLEQVQVDLRLRPAVGRPLVVPINDRLVPLDPAGRVLVFVDQAQGVAELVGDDP